MISTSSQQDVSRLGVVTGKRVGNAVVRNRSKRRIKEAVRMVGLPPERDVVVVASAQVDTVPFSTVCQWVEQGLHTHGLEDNGK